MIEKHVFKGADSGPNILFTGRVHGNEPCGEIALRQIIEDIQSEKIILKKGQITVLPRCNPKASDQNKRFIDVNLNRIMSDNLIHDHQHTYEASIAPDIMNDIDQCDYFVDLHSFTEDMPPVVICIDDQNEQSRAMATACAIKRIECDSPLLTKPGSQMTTHYARHNKKPAIIIEAGQHNDPHSVDVAYQAILNILISFDMIEGEKARSVHHDFLVVRSALYREDGQKLIFPLMDKDFIQSGDPVFETKHGDIIHAHDSGLLFMRNENTPVGEEYAYICDVYDDWPNT